MSSENYSQSQIIKKHSFSRCKSHDSLFSKMNGEKAEASALIGHIPRVIIDRAIIFQIVPKNLNFELLE